jgi:hypothetical protein
MLNWLSPLNYSSAQDDHASRARKGAGNWLLESQSYDEWENGDVEKLWCVGKRTCRISFNPVDQAAN